jgi:acetyl-CoA acyltransferase
VFEINEAFAAQAVYCQRELGIPDDKLNVNGGAIALGHPLGCTGAKLTATLIHELRRRGGGLGIVSMCIGGGMGAAGLFEVR